MEDKIIFDTLNYVCGGIIGAYFFSKNKNSWPVFLAIQAVVFALIVFRRKNGLGA